MFVSTGYRQRQLSYTMLEIQSDERFDSTYYIRGVKLDVRMSLEKMCHLVG